VNGNSPSIPSDKRSPSVLTIPAHNLLRALDGRATFIADHRYLPHMSFVWHGRRSPSS